MDPRYDNNWNSSGNQGHPQFNNTNDTQAGNSSPPSESTHPQYPGGIPTRPTYTPSTSTSSIPTYQGGSGDHSNLTRIQRRPVPSKTPSESSNSPTGTGTTSDSVLGGDNRPLTSHRIATPFDDGNYEYFDPHGYAFVEQANSGRSTSPDEQPSSSLFTSKDAGTGLSDRGDTQTPRGLGDGDRAISFATPTTPHADNSPYGHYADEVVRKPTMARRILDRGTSTLQRMKTNARRKSKSGIEGSYAKINDDEDDADGEYGFDMSSYDSFPMYNEEKPAFSVNTAYRSRRGDNIELDPLHRGTTFDLSSNDLPFQTTSTRSATTFYGQDLSIPVDQDPPNWRPWEMNWPYLTAINLLTFGLFGVTEYLIQLSETIGERGFFSYQSASQISLGKWVAWKYAPTVIGVVFGVLWQVTDTETKRNEPYYQMSKPDGAIAKYSLNVDYFEFLSFLTPFQGAKYKQWAVTCSATCYFISYAIIPNLLGALLDTEPVPESNNGEKYLRVDVKYARALEVMFLIVGMSGTALQVILWRRKSGLVGDVSGIAGIAAMANKSHILMDFRGLDDADEKTVHDHLSKRRYRLHKMSLYLGQDVAANERPEYSDKKRHRRGKGKLPIHPIFTFTAAIPFAILLIVILAIMPILAFTSEGKNFLEKVPFTAIFLGVLIKSIWEVLDKNLRIIQPFHTLTKEEARPHILTLDYTGTIPGWVTIKALRNHHWLLALVTFDSILIEILTVTMGSFLNRSAAEEETKTSFNVSYSLATVICSGLLATLFITTQRRRKPFLPRQPGTIASVLTFIHQSKMVTDFEKMEFWSTAKREEKLVSLNKRYAFGWFSGRDRQTHLGIDQCPIMNKYEFGKDYREQMVTTVGGFEYY